MNRRTTVKLSISGALLLYAIAAVFLFGGRTAVPVAVGMLFGFHGDICLAGIPEVKKRYKEPFIFGILSFMAGHLLYIMAFIFAMDGAMNGAYLAGGLVVYTIVAFVIWTLSMRHAKDAPAPVRFGSLAYAVVIGVMAAFALALAGTYGGIFWVPAAGGLLFVVSDSFIAFGEFGGREIPHRDTLIWGTYAPAQLCIVLLPMLLYTMK